MKTQIQAYIQSRADEFIRISDEIWEYAELSLNEYKSVKCYLDFLKAEGFTVREQAANVPTAFVASYGQGRGVDEQIGIAFHVEKRSVLSENFR